MFGRRGQVLISCESLLKGFFWLLSSISFAVGFCTECAICESNWIEMDLSRSGWVRSRVPFTLCNKTFNNKFDRECMYI